MLQRLYIDNFLCFVNFEYKPEQKQLLLGANGSGKSSLLDAIRFLKKFVAGGENPFTQFTRTRWQNLPLQVFELEAVLNEEKYEYRVEIGFEAKAGSQSLHLERLKVSGDVVFEYSNEKISFYSNDSAHATTVPLATQKSALQLSKLSNQHVRRFMEWMDAVYCFRLDVYPGKMDESTSSPEDVPDYELENFPALYLDMVQSYPEKNVAFLKAAQDAIEGLQTLRFSTGEDGMRNLRVDFSAPGKGVNNRRNIVSYDLSELSDGQRCLLGLYFVLSAYIANGHTVFIDEPDNFVSLREIQPWLLAAEQMVEASNSQLILISHHPEILNQWAVAYGLRFFREENGHVRTEKFKPDTEGMLQPSELIARGWENG